MVNLYDEDQSKEVSISAFSVNSKGTKKPYAYSNRLLPLSSESIAELDHGIQHQSSNTCFSINGVSNPSNRICKTCADYLRFYGEQGYKTSKLVSQLTIVLLSLFYY